MRVAGLFVAAVLAAVACGSPPEARAPAAPRSPATVTPALTPQPADSLPPRAAAFSPQRAWTHLEALVALGPRAHGTQGLARANEYIRAHLRACGASVRDIQTTATAAHDRTPRTFTSITATLGSRDGAWILLGTHHDTRSWADEDPDPARHGEPITGANDGTSGVAVLLEVATVLQELPADVGVELVFFDGEEWGKRGSGDYFVGSRDVGRRFGELYGSSRPALALVLDLVADADLRFERELFSERAARWLNDRLWEVGRQRYPFAFATSGEIVVHDDHVALIEAGIPAALLIDFEYPPWHTVSDTLDKCSRASLAITGRVLLEALLDRPLPIPAAD